jgi:predicted DNA-binding transcriptional regulator AlpA
MRYLRFPQLKAEKGIPWTRVHIIRLEKERKFPGRVRLSANTVAWSEEEVDAWQKARATERAA